MAPDVIIPTITIDMKTDRIETTRQIGTPVRIGVWAFLLVIALVTAGLQIDRQTRVSPQLFAVVPGLFKSQALMAETDAAITRKLPGNAALARQLVERRPVPAESLVLLSLSAVEEGQNDLADASMTLAASRGWRVPLANLLALAGAYGAGDYDGAVLRLAALNRLQPGDDMIDQGVRTIIASSEGRDALAAYAGRDSAMANAVLAATSQEIDPEVAMEMIVRTREAGAEFDCANLRWATMSQLRRGNASAAEGIWDSACAENPRDDASALKLAVDESDPFAWHLLREADLSRSTRSDHIRIRNKGSLVRTAAQRYATLEPGTYRIRPITRTSNNYISRDQADVRIAVSCKPGPQVRTLDDIDSVIEIGGECLVQLVSLQVGQGTVQIEDIPFVKLD